MPPQLNCPLSILIAPVATKPQLITLALDCLQSRRSLPDEVIGIHTRGDRPATAAALQTLRADIAQHYPHLKWHPLELSDGQGPLEDVVSPAEIEIAFAALYAVVRTAKLSERNVHLLIAGGRRTLTVLAMAVAQMLFDVNDRLWHLASHPALEASGRLHAAPEEWARLIEIPVITWGQLSPAFDALRDVTDPRQAIDRLRQMGLRAHWERARDFVSSRLSPAQQRVVELLVRDGLSNEGIGARLHLSERTVEQHLRSVFAAAADYWEMESVTRTQLIALLNLYYVTRLMPETTPNSTTIAGNPA